MIRLLLLFLFVAQGAYANVCEDSLTPEALDLIVIGSGDINMKVNNADIAYGHQYGLLISNIEIRYRLVIAVDLDAAIGHKANHVRVIVYDSKDYEDVEFYEGSSLELTPKDVRPFIGKNAHDVLKFHLADYVRQAMEKDMGERARDVTMDFYWHNSALHKIN